MTVLDLIWIVPLAFFAAAGTSLLLRWRMPR